MRILREVEQLREQGLIIGEMNWTVDPNYGRFPICKKRSQRFCTGTFLFLIIPVFCMFFVAPEYELLFRETLCTRFARLAHLDKSEVTSAFSKCYMNKTLGSSL